MVDENSLQLATLQILLDALLEKLADGRQLGHVRQAVMRERVHILRILAALVFRIDVKHMLLVFGPRLVATLAHWAIR